MSLLGNLTSLFGDKKSVSVLGIDIGSSSIKVVQLRKKGPQAVLETYGELSLGPYAGTPVGSATNLSQEKIIEALNDLLTEKEVNVTSRLCGVAIPFSSSLMSVMRLPEVSGKELAEMIPLEARKYIPVPMSEVTLDWSVIPKSDGPNDTSETEEASFQNPSLPQLQKKTAMVNVLVVAIHNETLARMSEVVKACNLSAGFFEIEIFSTLRSVVEENLQPVMILDMGAVTTKLFIVERGVLKASHTVNSGGQDITNDIAKSLGISADQAEVMKRKYGLLDGAPESETGGKHVQDIITNTLDYVFGEANRIVIDYEKKFNKPVSRIVMIGGGSALKGLNEAAKNGFQTEVVSGDPFSKVVTPAFLADVLRQTGPEFAVAVGLALRRLEEM
jgi:type IV pilus assembly protein PilM